MLCRAAVYTSEKIEHASEPWYLLEACMEYIDCSYVRNTKVLSTLHYPTELICAEIMVLINVSCELNEEEKEDGEIVNLADSWDI